MAGSAMLAIAVSSDAIASAVKIAAAAQRRRSAGRPSNGAGLFSGTAISATSDTWGNPNQFDAIASSPRCIAGEKHPAEADLHKAYALSRVWREARELTL